MGKQCSLSPESWALMSCLHSKWCMSSTLAEPQMQFLWYIWTVTINSHTASKSNKSLQCHTEIIERWVDIKTRLHSLYNKCSKAPIPVHLWLLQKVKSHKISVSECTTAVSEEKTTNRNMKDVHTLCLGCNF